MKQYFNGSKDRRIDGSKEREEGSAHILLFGVLFGHAKRQVVGL